jgi:hypothetical protein
VLLLLALTQLFTAAPASADWSCVTREGRLKTCTSLARCHRFFPACAGAAPLEDKECSDPHCRFTSPEAASPAPPPPMPPPPVKRTVAPPTPPKRFTKPGELAPLAAPTLQVRAEKKLEEVRTLVHTPHTDGALSKVRGESGLSPEQEARLYGSASSSSLSKADHLRLVNELRVDSELRNELRRQLASRSSGEHAYDPAAAAALNAVLTEAEGGPKSEEHMKPLAPDEAFGADKQ